MPGLYGTGNYSANLYSASIVFDGEAEVDFIMSYSVKGSRVFNSASLITADVDYDAEAKQVFGGIATVDVVVEVLPEGRVVHVYRGEAQVTMNIALFAASQAEFSGEAQVDFATLMEIESYYAGPFWDPEEIDGGWTPETPPDSIWVPESPFPKPWG